MVGSLSRQHLQGAVVAARARTAAAGRRRLPRPEQAGPERRSNVYISGRGQFGRYLPRGRQAHRPLKRGRPQEIITDLFTVLSDAGLLTEAVKPDGDDVAGYRLRAAVISWHQGTGLSGAEDRVRRTLDNEGGPRVNPFFRDLYTGRGRHAGRPAGQGAHRPGPAA